jgi:Flp pilus assembly protein TadD
VMLRNRIVGGEWAVTTAQFGPNFYIGNNPNADGTYRPLVPWRGNPTFEQADATALAEQQLGRTLTAGEVSAFYRDRVLAFIRDQPARWAALLARKALLTVNAVEIPDTEDQYTYSHWSWILRLAAIWNFGTLVGAAVVGALWRSEWRRLWIFYAMALVYAGSVVLFYVFARYRFVLVPPLALLAGAAASELAAIANRRSAKLQPRARSRSELVASALVFAAIVLVSRRSMVPRSHLESLMRFNTGAGLQAAGRTDDAIEEYRAAAALYPALPQVHYNLGILLRDSGRVDDAIAELREAVRWAPGDPRALNNLGVAFGQAGRSDEAERCFREALAADPNLAAAHNNLAEWYAAHGRLDDAAEESQKAVALAPSLVPAWKTLTRIRSQQGRFEQALAAAQQGASLAPDDPAALNALGIALAGVGRTQEAIAALQRALARDPANASIQRNLGRLRHTPG